MSVLLVSALAIAEAELNAIAAQPVLMELPLNGRFDSLSPAWLSMSHGCQEAARRPGHSLSLLLCCHSSGSWAVGAGQARDSCLGAWSPNLQRDPQRCTADYRAHTVHAVVNLHLHHHLVLALHLVSIPSLERLLSSCSLFFRHLCD